MPDRTRKRTSKRARYTPVHGLGAVLLGLLFLATSLFVVLLSADIIPPNPSFRRSLPLRWYVGSTGCLFAAASVLGVIEGVRGVLWQRRRTRILASRPGAAWLADYRWNQKGAADRVLWKAIGTLLGVIVASTFLVPATYFIFLSFTQEGFGIRVDISMFGIALFDLVALGFLARAGHLLRRWHIYGSGLLVFNRFPFFLGESLEASFRTSRTLTGCRSFEATLRCIEERYRTTTGVHGRRGRNGLRASVRRHDPELRGPLRGAWPRVRCLLAFRSPRTHAPRSLLTSPPTYWEIEIMVDRAGVDYKAAFLVPVYAKT